MNKRFWEFWEAHKEYALDIELFKKYWDGIGCLMMEDVIDEIQEKLKEKNGYNTNFKMPWSEMRKFIFFEDLEFVLEQLNYFRSNNMFYSMQFEEFPYLVERRDLIVELIKKKLLIDIKYL